LISEIQVKLERSASRHLRENLKVASMKGGGQQFRVQALAWGEKRNLKVECELHPLTETDS
jgi:hypothetical protein